MTEMFGEAWSPMSVPDLAPDDDDDDLMSAQSMYFVFLLTKPEHFVQLLVHYTAHTELEASNKEGNSFQKTC